MARKITCLLVRSVVEGLKLETMLCGAGPDAKSSSRRMANQLSICRNLEWPRMEDIRELDVDGRSSIEEGVRCMKGEGATGGGKRMEVGVQVKAQSKSKLKCSGVGPDHSSGLIRMPLVQMSDGTTEYQTLIAGLTTVTVHFYYKRGALRKKSRDILIVELKDRWFLYSARGGTSVFYEPRVWMVFGAIGWQKHESLPAARRIQSALEMLHINNSNSGTCCVFLHRPRATKSSPYSLT